MKKWLFALLVFNCQFAISQVDKMPLDSIQPKPEVIEEMPKYPGGEEALMKLIADNFRYPHDARDNGIQGKVILSFIIEKDGSVTEIKVVKGIGGSCDEEALRVAGLMEKWTPGHQNFKPVRVRMNMPMNFKLEGTKKEKRKRGWFGSGN